MPQPITKIVIILLSQDALKDIWKLFDFIITKMEELDKDGMPKVDAQRRKKFRAEVMRAPDGTALEVFHRWVTLLVPELVPVTSNLIQQVTNPPTYTNASALEQARIIGEEEKAAAKEEVRKEKIREQRRESLRRAREVMGQRRSESKSHHKKKKVGL